MRRRHPQPFTEASRRTISRVRPAQNRSSVSADERSAIGCTATVLSCGAPGREWLGRRRDFAAAEHRRVPAFRQVDDDLVVLAFLAVVALETGAQPAGLHAHDRIGPRVERGLPAEDLHADRVFLEVVGLCPGAPGSRRR